VSRSPERVGSGAGPARKPPARGLTVAAAVLALLATLGLVPPPAAADDSRAPATPRKVVQGDPYKLVGAKVAAQLKAAQSINGHATGPKRKVLDYKLANRYDKGHTTVRRQFAASWLWSGRSIKNISKKEREVVKSYVRKYFGSRKPSPDLVKVGSDASPRCQGRSGWESFGNGNWNVSLSSCQTSAIMRSLRYGGLAAGLIATKMGPSAPIGVVTAFLMEAGAEWIDLIRDVSSVNAVYVMRRLIGPARARTQVLTLMPQ
jgi:hypothetical protein